jgi:GNAT superfamily N-acetyltransferase
MHLAIRAARTDDGAIISQALDAAYGGGYLATFDRDGLPDPNDLWWVQSEKEVSVVDVDRKAAGLLVVARGRQWLVEELLLEGFGGYPARTQDALATRIGAHLTALFQRARQHALLIRAAETNAGALAVAHHLQTALANALLVYRHQGAKRPSARVPEGYQVRRSGPDDAKAVGRLVREVIDDRARAEEIERVVLSKDGRGYLAFKDAFPAGFAALEVRSGRGDWTVGVRETHRRRGVGRALAAAAVGALHARGVAPYATAWALDPVTGSFLRSLGFSVERTYFYLERAL